MIKNRKSNQVLNILDSGNLKVEERIGYVRYFYNYRTADGEINYGFPFETHNDQRVWVGISKTKFNKVSFDEALKEIEDIKTLYRIN
jgi:hypothetical protein